MNDDASVHGRIRVVMVEDSPNDAELLHELLRDDGLDVEVRRVDDAQGLADALGQAPDIVLSDVELPGFSGYRALEMVRAHDRVLPFVFVSGTIDEEMAVEALRGGANDYVLKDNPVRLPAAVTRAVREARLVRERERAEKELMRSQRLESMALLAAGLSHDLRNVLQPLLIVPELMEQYSDDARIRRLASLVAESGRRGHEMAESMLSFVRGSRVASESVDVASLFGSIELLLQGSLPRGVRLEVAPAADHLAIDGNRTELQQCLINLALNGLQAMEGQRGSVLRIEADEIHDSEGAGWTCLRVIDDGPGIDTDALGRLFTPFYTTKPDGTGLGLLSCKRIVEALGGRIAVDSARGRGTTVSLWFPLPAVEDAEWVPVPTWREGSGERVLLVDADTTRASLLVNALVSQGYDAAVARDVAAASARIEREGPPALLLHDADAWRGGAATMQAALARAGFSGKLVLLEGTDHAQPAVPGELFAVLLAPLRMVDVFAVVESAFADRDAASAMQAPEAESA